MCCKRDEQRCACLRRPLVAAEGLLRGQGHCVAAVMRDVHCLAMFHLLMCAVWSCTAVLVLTLAAQLYTQLWLHCGWLVVDRIEGARPMHKVLNELHGLPLLNLHLRCVYVSTSSCFLARLLSDHASSLIAASGFMAIVHMSSASAESSISKVDRSFFPSHAVKGSSKSISSYSIRLARGLGCVAPTRRPRSLTLTQQQLQQSPPTPVAMHTCHMCGSHLYT